MLVCSSTAHCSSQDAVARSALLGDAYGLLLIAATAAAAALLLQFYKPP
jgi:hypothetical protein